MLCIYSRLVFILANKMANSLLRRPSLNPPSFIPPPPPPLFGCHAQCIPRSIPQALKGGNQKRASSAVCNAYSYTSLGFHIPAFFYDEVIHSRQNKAYGKASRLRETCHKANSQKRPFFNPLSSRPLNSAPASAAAAAAAAGPSSRAAETPARPRRPRPPSGTTRGRG